MDGQQSWLAGLLQLLAPVARLALRALRALRTLASTARLAGHVLLDAGGPRLQLRDLVPQLARLHLRLRQHVLNLEDLGVALVLQLLERLAKARLVSLLLTGPTLA